MPSLKSKNRFYLTGLIGLVGFFASAPLLLKNRNAGHNLTTQKEGLTGSQIMRGAYLNTGSKDVGADPDWNNGKYIGPHKEQSAFQPSAVEVAEARARFEKEKARRGLPTTLREES